MSHSRQAALALATTLLVACAQPDPPAALSPTRWFDQVAQEAGVSFHHRRAYETRRWLPEIMTGGACWLDYDGDDWLDLYLVQGGELSAKPVGPDTSKLYRNLHDGTFADVTAEAGVGFRGVGMGCAVGDYDGDSRPDLYVTALGANVLYHNRDGQRFDDVTVAAAVGDPSWSTSAVFLDYDRDGDLDLFVTNYIQWSRHREPECFAAGSRDYCSPKSYNAPASDRLFRNDGGGAFRDVSAAAGLARVYGNGLGVVAADFDQDGWIDLYVANDGTPNQLWHNLGDGSFADVAVLAGAAVNAHGSAEAGMGVVTVDIENDGDLDLFVTHLAGETNTLYVQADKLAFEDGTARAGLAAPSLAATGFGTGFFDFDRDGQLDLFITNGRVVRSPAPERPDDPYAESDQLFAGAADGHFRVLPNLEIAGVPLVWSGRAAAFADYDNDGDTDIAIVNNGGDALLLRNRATTGTWLSLRVLERNGVEAVGARVKVLSAGRAHWLPVGPAFSYLASNDPRLLVGLGDRTSVDDVTVVWADGTSESLGPRAVNQRHTLRRGEGQSRP